MKAEHKWTTVMKLCRNCGRYTVHALSKSGDFYACGCGEIIRIDTVSNNKEHTNGR